MKPDQLADRIIDQIDHIAKQLPEADRRYHEWTRGGHKKASIGEGGSRGNEHPIPVSQKVRDRKPDGTPTRWGPIGPADDVDREIRRRRKTLFEALLAANNALIRAEQELTWFLKTADPIEDPPEIPCANLRCTNMLEPGRNEGECSRCRKHKSRHGLSYPQQP